MTRFTFARGNAQKVLALPLYALGAAASLVVPRGRGRWVFGSGTGVGGGALALYRAARERDPGLRLDWLARDDRDRADAAAAGVPSTRRSSARGLWLTLRAEVAVVTHGFGDVNRFGTRGAFVVQLWHGIPLKLVQLDSPATMSGGGIPGMRSLRGVLRTAYRRGFRGIGLMPAASELTAAHLRTAFSLPADRVVVTGDPRDDVLERGTAEQRRDAARALLAERLGGMPAGRVILYAPTWRDGAPDPAVPTLEQWHEIAATLDATDSTLLLRSHPLGVGDYRAGVDLSPRIRLFGSDVQREITPVLPAIDLLVTDYSSIAFDVSLTGAPILFLAPDVDAYSDSRGLYQPYRTFSGGHETRDWPGLLAQLRRLDDDGRWAAELRAHAERLADERHAYRDGENSVRVYEQITRRLESAAR